MSMVPLVFSGVFYPKGKGAGDKPQPGTFVGNAVIGGLGVGGGPVIPPGAPPGGGGGGERPPHPAFPIWGPPGTNFPGIPGYPPVAGHPLPEVPPPDVELDPGWEKKVAWTPTTGWIVVIIPKDETLVPTPSRRDR